MKSELRLFAEKETNLGERFIEASSEYDYLVVYGCGSALSFYLKWLEKYNINKPIYFVDSNRTGEINGCRIHSNIKDIEENIDFKRTAVIVSSPQYRKEIIDKLKGIVPVENIYAFEVELDVNFDLQVGEYRRYVNNHIDDFCQLQEWFSDSFSVETMKSVIKGRISGNLDYYENVAVFPQYFGNEFVNANAYYRFVDCGAYIGDTFQIWDDLIKSKQIPMEKVKYYGLEPDPQIAKCLKEAVKGKEGYTSIFEVGAWNSSGVLRFEATNGGTSKIIENDGNKGIRVVSLDELLSGEKVTMIKMDIGGSEMQALEGAVRLIKEQKPCLAICVYHKNNDLIDITKKVHSILPEYRLYLRHHSFGGAETVLYAVI